MKRVLILMISASVLASCGSTASTDDEASVTKTDSVETAEGEASVYPYMDGGTVNESEAMNTADFLTAKQGFEGDSMDVTLSADIVSACTKKGCWMKVDLGNGEDMMVRFKDYGFFVPLDAAGHKTVVTGKAFNDTIDVATLKHYAEDAGASEDSIAKITEPQITYSFLAEGVLVK